MILRRARLRKALPALIFLAALIGAAAWFWEIRLEHERQQETANLNGRFLQTTPFVAGVNYPWLMYGGDFGGNAWGHYGVSRPESTRIVDDDFAYLEKHGVKFVRWFVFCDGRAGLKYDPSGQVAGLGDHFYDDLDTAVAIAHSHHISLVLVLFDYKIFDQPVSVGGVQLGGHSRIVSDPAVRQSFLDNALKPILQRYGNSGTIIAWEVINEPEWAMKIPFRRHMPSAVSVEVMRQFVEESVDYVHRYSAQVATVGSAERRLLYLWKGTNLDFYEFHWYPTMERGEPLDVPVADLHLDKPCIVGEFPSADARRGAGAYLNTYLKDGYAGAFVWSYRATDRFTNFPKAAPDLGQWLNNHARQGRSASFSAIAPGLGQWFKEHPPATRR